MPDQRDLSILRELRDDLHCAYLADERRVSARRRRSLWLLPAGGLVAAAAVAALVLSSGLAGAIAPEPAAAAMLRRAATAAQAIPFPRDDQFFYTRSRSTDLVASAAGHPDAMPTALVTKERSIWTSVERPGRLEERIVETQIPNAAERERWRRAGSPLLGASPASFKPVALGPTHDYQVGSLRLTRRQILALPTDPHRLYRLLLAHVGSRGSSPEAEVFTEIGDALGMTPAPVALRAALYRALALVPDVRLTDRVTDGSGRVGTQVSFTTVGIEYELLFDPDTGRMLDRRGILVSPAAAGIDLPAGTAIADTIYQQQAVTDDLRRP